MPTAGRTAAIFTLSVLTAGTVCMGAARADTTIVEERRTSIAPAPVATSAGTITIAQAAVRRSNYNKRLSDMRDQIGMGLSRGWLSAQQADDLRSWNADVGHEVSVFSSAGGGVVPRETVDQVERHVNSLAWMINRLIGEGSRRLQSP